ncbi:type IV pilus secretin PilQ [Marinobacter sp. AN1]|uniref:type IV pilus secretin PilQ n=1 Tax=Marinobacter sp. AN1 TaxID=2886046 RepID=UPI00222FAD27|nr:type IV pilus secretin PilQ [Marinobacter sp. AN1]UZD66686.1 type IV pilus secretin PilQ [Marinobacter sp. AN1]
MFRKFTVWMSAAGLAMAAGIANAATLQDVEFSSLSGDRTEVVLSFDETPPEPSGYTIERPARIAIDLKGTVSGLDSRNMSLGDGNTQSMTVVETQDRTRLIFNLVELAPYDTEVSGNQLVITIGDADSGAAVAGSGGSDSVETASSGTRTSTSARVSGDAITGVDFRRGADGEGRVIIDLSNSRVPVALNEQGGRIRLVMDATEVPNDLRRRLDVTDFATPVTRVDTFTEGGDAIVEIRPEGAYDYLAYQSGNRFTVSVEKLTEEEAERRREEKFPYTGDKLSLNFQDIEVRSVLQLIADFTGLNLVASDTVSGSITLRLQNVPWDQALDLILKTKGLDKRQIGNVLLVAPAEEIAARERLELETNKQIAELAPVRLEIIQVNYAKAGDIVGLIEQDEELISDRGFISSDVRTNTISVRETADKLEEIRRLVNTWDIPVRQVSIEARIVRAQTNVAESLGVRWGGGYLDPDGSNTRFGSGSIEGNESLWNDNEIVFPDALAVDLGVSDAGASSFAIGLGGADFLVELELSALESDGKAELVSQPKVVTADRQTATIKSGEEIPYQKATSSGATSVSFKEAALSLEVTPQITPDNKIIMDLRVNQDSRGQETAGIPSINTNEVTTQVLVGNGETVVLGGIFQSEIATTVTKTPFLGDIPYVGALFRRTENIDERSELLIFITPKIMRGDLID